MRLWIDKGPSQGDSYLIGRRGVSGTCYTDRHDVLGTNNKTAGPLLVVVPEKKRSSWAQFR